MNNQKQKGIFASMKPWLKGGLIGFVVLTIFGILNNWNSYYHGVWTTNRLIVDIIKILFITLIFGFLFGVMVITIIKNVKTKKIYYISVIVFTLHFIITLLAGFLIKDDYLIILAPLLIGCVEGCKIISILLGVFLTSLSLAFISFLIIWIIGKIKS